MKIEIIDESFSNFVVVTSWGSFFAGKLNNIANPERLLKVKELMFKSLENLLG